MTDTGWLPGELGSDMTPKVDSITRHRGKLFPMRALRAAVFLVLCGCPAILGLDQNYVLDGGGTSDDGGTDAIADVPPENACGMNRLICNGNCIDVAADPMNCGLCG